MHTLTEQTRPAIEPATRPGFFFVRGHPRSGTNWVGSLLDLHTDTEAQRLRLFRFLSLDPNEAEALSDESFTTAGYTIHDPTTYRRKGEVGDWQNYFTGQAKTWFHDIAGESLVQAGYADDGGW